MNLKELESDKRVVWADLIFSGLDESAPLRILDMGCGPGFFSILCALRGHCVTGTDLNEKMLERAGEITGLVRQQKIELIPKTKLYRACYYVCDFIYYDKRENKTIYEDVKGVRTKEYLLNYCGLTLYIYLLLYDKHQ
jgi:SAM-dependent methyltransferase